MEITVLHTDHGITQAQMTYIKGAVKRAGHGGFFIQEVTIPEQFGPVPSGLHGPDAGDPPVEESEVIYEVRGDRPWTDRLVDRPFRSVNFVQVIGMVDEKGDHTLFTAYGGPLAPQHPEDPGNPDAKAAARWWSNHALSR